MKNKYFDTMFSSIFGESKEALAKSSFLDFLYLQNKDAFEAHLAEIKAIEDAKEAAALAEANKFNLDRIVTTAQKALAAELTRIGNKYDYEKPKYMGMQYYHKLNSRDSVVFLTKEFSDSYERITGLPANQGSGFAYNTSEFTIGAIASGISSGINGSELIIRRNNDNQKLGDAIFSLQDRVSDLETHTGIIYNAEWVLKAAKSALRSLCGAMGTYGAK